MELQHINVKIFFKDPLPPINSFIPIFHRWIQQGLCEELLIDVVDYQHVSAGPGLILTALQAHYSIDFEDNHPGLLYNRRAVMEGSNQDRLRQALRAALSASQRLASEPELKDLRFHQNEIQIFINDRALAHNTEANRQSLQKEFSPYLEELFDGWTWTAAHQDPHSRLGLNIKTRQAFDLQTLLDKLGGSAMGRAQQKIIQHLTPQEAKTILDQDRDVIYLDVRSTNEFSASHTKGAFNIPLADQDTSTLKLRENPNFLEEVQKKFGKDKKILVGCQTGKRSEKACDILQKAGYQDLSIIQGRF